MNSPSLALVVIGKDSEQRLKETYSTDLIRFLSGYVDELIYVDSCSEDRSVNLMKSLGFAVYDLSGSTYTCASAARRVGTEVSRCDYILYLDSDMEIQSPSVFFDILGSFMNKKRGTGCVGKVVDIYPDGRSRNRVRKLGDGEVAGSFGGFVLLSRKDVLSCGNWSASLKANEELDLHLRLRACGKKVVYLKDIEVKHYTIVVSQLSELLSLYFPTRPARYAALGKVAKRVTSFKHLAWFIRMNSEVFLLALLLIFGSFVAYYFFAALAVFYIFYVTLVRGWKFNFVVSGLLLSLSLGLLFPVERNVVNYESK